VSFRDYAACFVVAAAVGLLFAVIVECALSVWIALGALALFTCLAR